ncbi:unnamed protein product [Urochloa decumbens]|uniref:PHD finger protein ALFIN-LIKE n=1 Tax=Urochloa decumbens TaxID=240449 RepID=A0ABC8W2R3_9POAL
MDSPQPLSSAESSSSQKQAAQPLHGQQDTAAPTEVEVTLPPAPAAAAAPVPVPAVAILRPRYSGTVERTFRQFTYRRVALIRAVTQDEKVLFQKCNPREYLVETKNHPEMHKIFIIILCLVMEPLCLYGNTNGSWEVLPPKLFAPSGQPEPKLGVNLVRDKMRRLNWLQYISSQSHSDAWLIRISFFHAADLEVRERQRLFTMISMLPTVLEMFTASETYRRICDQENMINVSKDEDEGCGSYPTICASCGDQYHANGFWVRCTLCKCWSHGKCVKVKFCQEELIRNFECPECCAEKRGFD